MTMPCIVEVDMKSRDYNQGYEMVKIRAPIGLYTHVATGITAARHLHGS